MDVLLSPELRLRDPKAIAVVEKLEGAIGALEYAVARVEGGYEVGLYDLEPLMAHPHPGKGATMDEAVVQLDENIGAYVSLYTTQHERRFIMRNSVHMRIGDIDSPVSRYVTFSQGKEWRDYKVEAWRSGKVQSHVTVQEIVEHRVAQEKAKLVELRAKRDAFVAPIADAEARVRRLEIVGGQTREPEQEIAGDMLGR